LDVGVLLSLRLRYRAAHIIACKRRRQLRPGHASLTLARGVVMVRPV
jgi:hypothetical protein